jgi:hypothetical protein
MNLRAVNAALWTSLVEDERGFANGVDRPPRGSHTAPGVYQTLPRRELISASTVVVSVLVPTLKLYPPGGNDGARWISTTVRVADARQVHISDLFVEPTRGLKIVAAAARRRLLASNPCIRSSSADRSAQFKFGFEPSVRNYRYFALLPSGLAIGFPLGQVGFPACGRVEVIVPYSAVRANLSFVGRELIGGVRRAR